MMSPIEISLSEDSLDFDTTPIPFMDGDASMHDATPRQPIGHDQGRASHHNHAEEWIHSDASSQQSWFGGRGGGSGSWYDQTTSSFASCCQMLPDAFMPPRHSFTPPQSPSPMHYQQVRVARSPPPPPRKPAPTAPRTSPTSSWRSMRSSCYEAASRRYYKNDYGNQNHHYDYEAYPEHQTVSHPQSHPPPPPQYQHEYHQNEYEHQQLQAQPSHDHDFVHHSEPTDASEYEYAHRAEAPRPYAQAYQYQHSDDHHMSTPQSQVYSAKPEARKYSNEYREPAPVIPPIVSPTPTYPSPGTVAKASAEEICDANSICDDPHLLRPNDIVCGRGAPSQFHQGNAAFRDIIGDYQTVYLCARRSEKPRIANQVMEEIRKTGGRFVRRTKRGTKHRGAGVGAFAWEEIEEKKALEKVCQALRDGAPELQRQMLAASR